MQEDDLPYAAIVRNISEAFIYADRKGIIRWWSEGAEKLFGFTKEEALGKSLDLIIPENLRDGHWRGFNAAMETGDTKYHGRIMRTRSLHKPEEKIYVEMSCHLA